MSIGKRIQIIRKENGLSQEAFGASINVTRQSISKWEADLSIPEVDKCIEIAKKYNVSIEWLLGVRENKEDSKTLTEEQYLTIEEIVKKYTTKQKKYSKYIMITFMFIVIISGILLFNKIQSMNHLQNNIQNNINNINDKVNEQNDNLNKLEELLFNQQEIIINEITFNNHDYKNNTANLHIDITPKEIQNNMNIKFYINNGIKTIESISIQNNKNFTSDIQITLTDMMLISATIQTNTSEKTVYIDKIENALSNTSYKAYDYTNYGFVHSSTNNKRITSLLVNSKYKSIQDLEIKQIKSYIFINSKFHSILDSNISYNDRLKKYSNELEIDVSNINEKEVTIEIIDVLTDSSDRTYITGGFNYSLNLSNYKNPQVKINENYKSYVHFEWERYE